jgi:hypothetical protein
MQDYSTNIIKALDDLADYDSIYIYFLLKEKGAGRLNVNHTEGIIYDYFKGNQFIIQNTMHLMVDFGLIEAGNTLGKKEDGWYYIIGNDRYDQLNKLPKSPKFNFDERIPGFSEKTLNEQLNMLDKYEHMKTIFKLQYYAEY